MKALIKYLPDKNRNKAPIVRIHNGYVVLAQSEIDFKIKCDKISRGDIFGFCKLKPFVTTQDIKVGDEIFCPNYSSGASYFTATDILLNGSIEVSNVGRVISIEESKDCFKILGEVSPEATFVEDGKEYEVKRVRLWRYSRWQKESIYLIKCPCCGDFK